MTADAQGNIWIASYGNDSVYVFLGGDPNQSVFHQRYSGSQPFGIAIAADGTAWVTNSGGIDGQDPRSVAKYALVTKRCTSNFSIFWDKRSKAWLSIRGETPGLLPRANSTIYAIRA